MMGRCFIFGLFCLFIAGAAYGDTVYTWTDESGVIHISRQQPPQNARQAHRLLSSSASPSDSMSSETPSAEKSAGSVWLEKVRQAERERQKADEARRAAEAAVAAANRLRRETDAFLEPWRSKTRIKRPEMRRIETRIQAANEAIQRAERLIEESEAAMQKARDAALEAKKAELELFEQYRQIVND